MRTSRLATLSVVFLLGALAVPSSPAETPRPVKWTLSAETEENLPLRKGAMVVAQLRATIDSGWHLYSLDQEPGDMRAEEPGRTGDERAGHWPVFGARDGAPGAAV